MLNLIFVCPTSEKKKWQDVLCLIYVVRVYSFHIKIHVESYIYASASFARLTSAESATRCVFGSWSIVYVTSHWKRWTVLQPSSLISPDIWNHTFLVLFLLPRYNLPPSQGFMILECPHSSPESQAANTIGCLTEPFCNLWSTHQGSPVCQGPSNTVCIDGQPDQINRITVNERKSIGRCQWWEP